eukprot:Em0199g1a
MRCQEEEEEEEGEGEDDPPLVPRLETTTHESGQLCLPHSRPTVLSLQYPKIYIECLVVDTGALKEYVKAYPGRRHGAAAIKIPIPRKSVAADIKSSVPSKNNAAATSQTPSPPLSHDQQGLELGPHREAITIAAVCIEALEYNQAIILLNHIAMTTNTMTTSITCAILFGRGLAHYKMEHYAHAEPLFRELREVAVTTPIKDGSGFMAEVYLGDIYTVRFELQTPSLSQLHVKCGVALRKANKIMQALEALKEGVACAHNDRDLLSAHATLGNLYQGLGDSQGAVEEYLECVMLAERSGDWVSLGWNHGNLGNAYVASLQKDKAIHHLQISLELTLQHEPTPQSIGRAYNNLGTAYQSLLDLEKAEQHYNLALDQSVYGKDSPGQARALGNLGNIAMLKKDYDSAHRYFTDTLGLTRDRSIRIVALHNRGCCTYEKAELLLKASGRPCPPLIVCGWGIIAMDDGTPQHVHLTEDVTKEDLGQLSHFPSPAGLPLPLGAVGGGFGVCRAVQGTHLRGAPPEEDWREPHSSPLLPADQGQSQVVIFLSYTGSRLLVWVITPDWKEVRMQLNLDGILFDEKPLDIYLRHGFPSEIADRDLEMALSLVTTPQPKPETQIPPLDLVRSKEVVLIPDSQCLPFQSQSQSGPREVVLIPDSYTSLPFIALCDPSSQQFIGDTYQFHTFPSILTMATVMGLHHGNGDRDAVHRIVTVNIPPGGGSDQFCIVGDPDIPTFMHSGGGVVPWETPPCCRGGQRAKVIHIATHGSAVSGFLAFAGQETVTKDAVATTKGGKKGHDDNSVLLFPQEVERLMVGAGLVVLSSCNSGRGTVRADGVQGMCRAFLVAGAHAILTTLWRVPDESAGIFMQFFYCYLMDGMTSAQALQKAVLSVRFFEKYSKPMHWGAYQLTGSTVRFEVRVGAEMRDVVREVGRGSVFPRLSLLMALEGALIDGAMLPSYVQTKHYAQFRGVFWLNGSFRELFNGAQQVIPLICNGPTLVIIDSVTELGNISSPFEALLTSSLTHIIILYTSTSPPTPLIREVDTRLVRGCTQLQLEPLSTTLTMQRMVHAMLSRRHFAPRNRDQHVLAQLVSLTLGCPDITSLTAELVYRVSMDCADPMGDLCTRLVQPLQAHTKDADRIVEFVDYVINLLKLDRMQQFVFWVLGTFGPIPILHSVATRIESLVLSVVGAGAKGGGLLIGHLLDAHLLKVYPSLVIKAPCGEVMKRIPLYIVPSLVCESALRGMNKMDAIFAIGVAHKALVAELAATHPDNTNIFYCAGMCRGLLSTANYLGDTLDLEGTLEELHRPLVQLASEGVLAEPWSGKGT